MQQTFFSVLLCAFSAIVPPKNALKWYNSLTPEWQKVLVHNGCPTANAKSIQTYLDTTQRITVFFKMESDTGVLRFQDIAPLTRFKKLKYLYANEVQIKDYSALQSLKKLQLLEVQTSTFSDKDLLFLKKMNQLRRLNIAQTSVSSLEPILHLPTLDIILCMETKIPRETIGAISERLPKKCRIIRDYL